LSQQSQKKKKKKKKKVTHGEKKMREMTEINEKSKNQCN
jgi:hypothetical protein